MDPRLSTQQQIVLNRAVKGESLFFTGAAGGFNCAALHVSSILDPRCTAGTGKTVLLRAIIERLKAEGRRLAVTASTGIAAINIGGSTLHSFAGIRLGKEPMAVLADRVMKSGAARERWLETEVLIIDESEKSFFPLCSCF
jgi:ATP-dependent DNA helicase PIF1